MGGSQIRALVGNPPKVVVIEEAGRKRARMGKKSRIALRKKMEAERNKQSESARMALEKEEAEREKRTRRNREKKLKKKEKEKAKKIGGTGPNDETVTVEGVPSTNSN